ncbi:MAG: hypothetical protein ACK4SY_06840 [Pyrobaculum sp.]
MLYTLWPYALYLIPILLAILVDPQIWPEWRIVPTIAFATVYIHWALRERWAADPIDRRMIYAIKMLKPFAVLTPAYGAVELFAKSLWPLAAMPPQLYAALSSAFWGSLIAAGGGLSLMALTLMAFATSPVALAIQEKALQQTHQQTPQRKKVELVHMGKKRYLLLEELLDREGQ